MLENPSLTTRITIGKIIGLFIGLLGFILLPYLMTNPSWFLRWGILFWYITFGAIIGVFGVYTEHPVLKLPMPWWFRSAALGAWLNLVLTFFAYDSFKVMLNEMFGPDSFLSSPFWFILEGAIVGLIIGFFATRFGGEGPQTVGK